MIKKIMSIFEKLKKTEEYSEEYFRREQEKARKSVEKFERERAVKIESIDVDSAIKIRYGGYQQYPESREMSNFNFIPSDYKSESREGYHPKTRFFLE